MHLYHVKNANKLRLTIKIQFCTPLLIGNLAPNVVANESNAIRTIKSDNVNVFEVERRFDLAAIPRSETR